MTKNEYLVWETLQNTKNVIEWAYGKPWEIEDELIHNLFMNLNDACIELSKRGKGNESDSE